MKHLLCIALLLLAAQPLESACFITPQHISARGFCLDTNDGTSHEFGEYWYSTNCWECVCSLIGYICCERYFMPEGFPADCMLTFDIQNCRFRLKKRKNPTIDCPVEIVVGK
ncbi:prostate-associated microseminoprotein-like [Leucoraja erinacea]|uniref:prostate-associated microseminoprotein-like n=1 Tax=Leucoraja erinaceus TaxID=7782 RepID=UPI002458A042|nr:prostate-associated microseminoprotein-like [Leucoraja erinacea]